MQVDLGRPRPLCLTAFGLSLRLLLREFPGAPSEELWFQLALELGLEFCSWGGLFHRGGQRRATRIVFPVVQAAARRLSHLSPHGRSGNAEGGLLLGKF